MFEEHLTKLTVQELKTELTDRGLETTGKKADLVTRLNTFLEGENTHTHTHTHTGEASSIALLGKTGRRG